ncbi:MAG: hypothetical protein JWQ65_1138 [Devosia sp.]|nr:hypothetical protein [Devosia sp.]
MRMTVPALVSAAVLLAAMSSSAFAADMLSGDNWPMAGAQSEISQAIGGAQVHEITIGGDTIGIEADHPTDPEQTRHYSWDATGIRTGMSMPNFAALGMGDTEPFTLKELDFTNLPAVKSAALAAFASEGAVITEIEGTKPSDRPGKKRLALWTVHINDTEGQSGEVLVSSLGQVLDTVLPPNRQAVAGPWLAPATIEATLARLEETFGPNARYAEIFINDERGHLTVEDPQKPGSAAKFDFDADSITRDDFMAMPMDATLERPFTMAEIAPLNAAMLETLAGKTLDRMGGEDFTVNRYTISRSILFMTPEDDRLLVEIRADAPDGWTGGRVTYDMTGAEVDVVTP